MAVYTVTPEDQADIAGLYAAFWNRAPDTTGFGYWVEKLASGQMTIDQIADDFRNAPEGVAAYPLWSTNVELVTEVYNNVFGRAPDAQGLAFWTTALDQGRATFPELVVDMIVAAETNGSADGALFTNKVLVGVYVATVAQTDNGYVTTNAFNLVTADPASVATAEAWVDANNTGATYTLTTNIDTINVTGHAVNTVVGVQDAGGVAAGQTYNSGDTINGNNLTLVNLVANGGASVVDINNVASVNVNLVNTSTLNSTEFTNVAQVAVTNGVASKTLIVENANLATTYAVNQARATVVDLNTFSNTLTGTADAVNLSVAGAGSKISAAATFDLGGNAIETVNLATTGTNFVALADAGSVKTVTISGSGTNSVDIGTRFATGVSVTGGSGTDTVYGIAAAAGGTVAPTLVGVEAVNFDFANANSYVSGSKFTGVTTVTANAASDNNISFTGLKSEVTTANINIDAVDSKTVAIGYANGSVADITVNVGTTKDADNVNIGALSITNVAGGVTLNSINSDSANVIAGLTDTKATSLTVNSSAGLTFGADVSTVKAVDYAFNSTAGTVLDLNTNQLVIGAADSKDRAINSIALSATGVDAATGLVGSEVSLEVEDTTSATYENAVDVITITTDVDGLATLDVIETNASTMVIGQIDASNSAGEVVINLADLAVATEVTTGSGTAAVDLTKAADTFNAGSGDVLVVTTSGADTINAGAGQDTVVISQNDDYVVVNDFTAGKRGDINAIDVSAWATVNGNGDAVAAGDAADFLTLASTAATATLGDTDNIVVMTGIIGNNAALQTVINGMAWTFDAGMADGDLVLFAYYDGANTNFVSVELDVVAGDDWIVDADIGASLTGVNTTALVAGNIGFVA